MIYSVWRQELGVYDYYEAKPRSKDLIAPVPKLGKPTSAIGFAPDDVLWPVPIGAKKVGSGSAARGMIAKNGSVLGDFSDEITEPSFLLRWGLIAGAAYWWFYKRPR